MWLFCFHFSKNERFANEDSQISDTDSDSDDDENEDKINVNIREIDTGKSLSKALFLQNMGRTYGSVY